MSNVGIDMQNEDGDTPLLTCLIHAKSCQYMKCLLAAGARITIANDKEITPLSLATSYSPTIARMLIEETRNTDFLLENTLSEKLHEAVKTLRCLINFFVINRGLHNETTVVSITTSHPLYSDNVAFRELSVFLNYLQAAEDINEYEFYDICGMLLRNSVYSDTAAAFKIIWNRSQHEHIAPTIPTLLHEFLLNCDYEHPEFIECLHLLLTSKSTSKLTADCQGAFNMSFYEALFMRLYLRHINKKDRIRTIVLCSEMISVFIKDVFSAYNCFQFNEEVVVLLQHLNPEGLRTDYYARILVASLEKEEKLSLDNLGKLNLVTRLSYRKLINMLPDEVLDAYKTLRQKKKVLNEVPSLFEISRHASQKCVQSYYNIDDPYQFHTTVEKLYLPNVIKLSLCQEPPLYNNYNEF